MKHRALKAAISVLIFTALAAAQDIASFEKRITVKKLPNGLTIVICERPEAPVFAKESSPLLQLRIHLFWKVLDRKDRLKSPRWVTEVPNRAESAAR